MSREMERAFAVSLLWIAALVYVEAIDLKIFCAFALGANFQTFMNEWHAYDKAKREIPQRKTE